MVAVIAHGLALIKRDIFGEDCDAEKCAVCALYHDVPEIFTGDMPSPVKYYDPDMVSAYRRIEESAVKRLLEEIPGEIRQEYVKIFSPDPEINSIVHAADKLSAYIKCIEELKAGNGEFKSAAQTTLNKLRELKMPEVDYFLENIMPSFEKTIDELSL